MKEFDLLNAMNELDDKYLLEAEQPAVKVRKSKKLWKRPAVIAACMCLVLAGTVAAANTVFRINFFDGLDWFDRIGGQNHIEEAGGFWPSTTVRVPMEEFSDEVKKLAEEEPADLVNLRGFNSWEELEHFIGLEVTDNPLLENAEKISRRYSFNGELKAEGNALLDVRTDLEYLDLSAGYRLYDTVNVTVHATVVSELIPQETGFLEYGMAIPYTEDMTVEEYTMANGQTATIISSPRLREDGTLGAMRYHAVFQGDNAVIWVESSDLADSVSRMEHMRQQDALTTLKEVLDAFE